MKDKKEKRTCKDICSYFIKPFDLSTPSLATLLGKCTNENSEHYEHILGLEHPICSKYKLG